MNYQHKIVYSLIWLQSQKSICSWEFSCNHEREMSLSVFPISLDSWPSAKQRPISFVESMYFWTHFMTHLFSLDLESVECINHCKNFEHERKCTFAKWQNILITFYLSSLVSKSQTQRLKQSCDIVLYVLKNSRKVLVWSSLANPILMFALAVSLSCKFISDILILF